LGTLIGGQIEEKFGANWCDEEWGARAKENRYIGGWWLVLAFGWVEVAGKCHNSNIYFGASANKISSKLFLFI
jgi:hypothetical protein